MKAQISFQDIEENMARAYGRSLPISTKASIEISNYVRGRTTKKAITMLEAVLEKRAAVPFKRFTDGVGHRKGAGIAAGRYPEKACIEFIRLIKQAESNAQAKGLSDELEIVHLSANRGGTQYKHGRKRRSKFKRTHIELVVREIETKKPIKKPKKKEAELEEKVEATEEKKVEEKVAPKKETLAEKKPKTKAVKKEPEAKEESQKPKKSENKKTEDKKQ